MFYHVFVLSLFLGLVEALCIARLCRVRYDLLYRWTIAANYLITGVGSLVFFPWLSRQVAPYTLGAAPLEHVTVHLQIMILLTASVTLLMKWPFIHLALRGTRCNGLHAFKASAVAVLVSYLLLVPYYLAFSDRSYFTATDFTPPPVTTINATATVYFLDPQGRPMRIGVDGSRLEQATAHPHEIYRTHYRPQWSRYQEPHAVGGEAVDLRQGKERLWHVAADDSAMGGIHFTHVQTGEHAAIGLSMPFLQWQARYATALPGGEVVFQFGDITPGIPQQIVLFNRQTRQLVPLATGSMPVVLLEKSPW